MSAKLKNHECPECGRVYDHPDDASLTRCPADDCPANMKTVYEVQIPNPIGDEWVDMGTFDTREEAVRFIKANYGGDDEGRICLIGEQDVYDD